MKLIGFSIAVSANSLAFGSDASQITRFFTAFWPTIPYKVEGHCDRHATISSAQ
jgi:hypothetical protein